jgi:hypothetical protein
MGWNATTTTMIPIRTVEIRRLDAEKISIDGRRIPALAPSLADSINGGSNKQNSSKAFWDNVETPR